MKILKAIFSLILAAALFSGGYMTGSKTRIEDVMSASPKLEEPEQIPPASNAPDPEPQKTEDGGLFIGKTNVSSVNANDTVFKEFEITLDQKPATLYLYTSAEYIDGEFLWDDSQNWTVEVKDAEGYYPLFSERVASGKVYIEALEQEDGNTVIMVYSISSNGTLINKYTFNKSGFLEKTVYDSGAVNTIMSTIPDYK